MNASASASASAEATRQRIVGVAAELFAKRGYHATGVQELCSAVGLGRGALYHHIDGKEDLLYEIASVYIRELTTHAHAIADAELDATEKVTKLSQHLIETISRHLPELAVCFGEVRCLTGERRREVMGIHQEYERIWRGVLEQGVATGEFQTADPVVLKGILGMHFYSYLWLDPTGKQTPAQIANVFSDMAVRGLQTNIEDSETISPVQPESR